MKKNPTTNNINNDDKDDNHFLSKSLQDERTQMIRSLIEEQQELSNQININTNTNNNHRNSSKSDSSLSLNTATKILKNSNGLKLFVVAMEISRQIGSITYVETSSYNPITVREAFEVAALSAHGKLLTFNNNLRSMMMMSPTISNVQTSSPFYGLKHFISLSTSSSSTTTATELSSPTTSINSDGSSNHSSSNFGGGGGGGPKLKTSSSSTHLTRNRSLFKLRKCKSKQDLHHHHQQQQQQQQQQHRTHGNGGLISMMMKIKNNNNVDNNNGHHKKSSSIISGLSSSIGDDNYSNSTNSCSNSEISKKSCIIM
ncbi:Rho- GTP-binding protein RhoE [Dermatophagoides farinae]|uniref:Rho- GTP-binding protein RhoE n=1 Tax=Dermatophagoides farinae TaxID=6954 RepID=A0A922HV09_DERFA|nr:Rho- GTP-binding protein RhoE [Dermatophagoides farinae]